MRDHLEAFGPKVEVVLITFTDPAHAARYVERYALDIPVLVDPDRTAYRSYGLARGSTARVWGWRSLRRYAQIIRRDGFARLERATEDTRQLGGDFIIDPTGVLTYGFWGTGPADRPPVDHLIAAARTDRARRSE